MLFIIKTTWSKVPAIPSTPHPPKWQLHRCVSKIIRSPLLNRWIPHTVQSCSWKSLLRHFNVSSISLWPGSSMKALCCTCVCLYHSYYVTTVTLDVLGFVVFIQGRLVVVSIPSVCVSSCAVCPLCLSSLLLAQSLDRKWEIYFIWLELHCSFLTTGVTSL